MGLEWPDKTPKRDGDHGCLDFALSLAAVVVMTTIAVLTALS